MEVRAPGHPVGKGLKQESASEMGLVSGISVTASLIDAHVGGVGM